MSPSGVIPGVLWRCHLGLHVMKKKARENNASFRFISPRQTDGRHASTICNDFFFSLYCNAPRRYVLIFFYFTSFSLFFSADTPHAWTYLMMPSVSVYFLLPPRLALVLLCWLCIYVGVVCLVFTLVKEIRWFIYIHRDRDVFVWITA